MAVEYMQKFAEKSTVSKKLPNYLRNLATGIPGCAPFWHFWCLFHILVHQCTQIHINVHICCHLYTFVHRLLSGMDYIINTQYIMKYCSYFFINICYDYYFACNIFVSLFLSLLLQNNICAEGYIKEFKPKIIYILR